MTKFFWMAVLTLVSACGGKSLNPYDKNSTKPTAYKIDQVKYIARDIFDTRDARSVGMPAYTVHENGRMLLRYSGFRGNLGNILTQQAILLRLHAPKEELAFARTQLRICPITKNWMTFATWQKAHVLNGGDWSSAGGDFDSGACASVMSENDPIFNDGREEKTFCAGDTTLCFNLGNWYQSYVQERGTDLGLIVINESAQPISIYGDGSSKYPTVFMRVPY